MKKRHDALAKEILRREYKHNSPYEIPDISYLPEDQRNAKANKVHNAVELMNRCPECYMSMLFHTATGKYLF